MRLTRIYNRGKILNESVYQNLIELDSRVFYNCGNEFYNNRDWWVILDDRGEIIAYCGSWYRDKICMFNRAWVHPDYRGRGLQDKMIKKRIEAARNGCNVVITYTTHDNYPSANNLIKNKFKLYIPQHAYAGPGMIYFKKTLL